MYKLTREVVISQPLLSNTGIWIPVVRGAGNNHTEINFPPKQKHQLADSDVLYWKLGSILPTKISIKIQDEVTNMPSSPSTSSAYAESCLSLDEPLLEMGDDDKIAEIIDGLGKGDAEQVVQNVIKYIADTLTYEYPPKTRNAFGVLECKSSDCGGYHSLFVAILRHFGIPAVMDFGARLPDCTPHVWAWWWNKSKEEWVMIDINDLQDKREMSDRVSFSLGTGPVIDTFPKPIQFIQNYLAWDWNYDLHAKWLKQPLRTEFLISSTN